jgi:hypothetical protein
MIEPGNPNHRQADSHCAHQLQPGHLLMQHQECKQQPEYHLERQKRSNYPGLQSFESIKVQGASTGEKNARIASNEQQRIGRHLETTGSVYKKGDQRDKGTTKQIA